MYYSQMSPPHNNGLKFEILREIARITRSSYGSRGLHRLLAVVCGQILRRFYPPGHYKEDYFDVAIEYEDRLIVNAASNNYLEWDLFFYGGYQIGIPLLLKRLIQREFVCIDVGANTGAYTLIMASRCGSQGRVLAFEPQPEERDKLRSNLALNRLLNVDIFPYGLSNQSGERTFFSPAANTGTRPNSSLHQENIYLGASVETVVEVRTLDSVVQANGLNRVDFIKIDTEGHDYFVLQGAQETIERFHPHILFEYSESWGRVGLSLEAGISMLESYGYEFYIVQHHTVVRLSKLKYSGQSLTDADILAVPEYCASSK